MPNEMLLYPGWKHQTQRNSYRMDMINSYRLLIHLGLDNGPMRDTTRRSTTR